MTWAAQMCALVILTDNCETNPGWDEWSWSTETPSPGLFLVYFLIYPYLFPFVPHYLLLSVPNMHYEQKGT